MSFDEFKEYVVSHITKYLPDSYSGASIELNEVVKNNDTKQTGLIIRSEANIAPSIYLESFYDKYQHGAGIDDILSELANLRTSIEPEQDFDITRITEFNQVKDKISCRLCNAGMNQELLSECPHTLVEALEVTYTVELGKHSDGVMSAPITNSLLEHFGITTEELHALAMENLSKADYEFKSMRDMLAEMMSSYGLSADNPIDYMLPPDEEEPSMYVLTNHEKVWGATALLNRGLLKDISDRLGGDFIVLPSSVHECIILPKHGEFDRNTLESMVQEVNAREVMPEERLSNMVYVYDSQSKELLLAQNYETRAFYRAVLANDDVALTVSEDKNGQHTYSIIHDDGRVIADNLTSVLPAKKVFVDKTVSAIFEGEFSGMTDIGRVVIAPESNLKSIGGRAFAGCKALGSVNLPDHVDISPDAFSDTALQQRWERLQEAGRSTPKRNQGVDR